MQPALVRGGMGVLDGDGGRGDGMGQMVRFREIQRKLPTTQVISVRDAGMKDPDRPAVERARRLTEGVKQRYADSGVVIILGATTGMMWHDRGMSFRAVVTKLWRAL